MLLSTLVHALQHLEQFDVNRARVGLQQHIDPIVYTVDTNEITPKELINQLDNDYRQILTDVSIFETTLNNIKQDIKQKITQIEPEYFSQSLTVYQEDQSVEISPDVVLDRTLQLSLEQVEFVKSRLCAQTDWRIPGLIIRPGRESWIEHLVALDPLYVIDQSLVLLEPVKQKFNIEYVNRLRLSIVNEYSTDPWLARLPDGQFGFCLSYNFFNYKPMEVLTQYLKEIYNKLRPGGVLAMTFNDCDRPGAVSLVEKTSGSYTPGHLICAQAVEIGYEIKFYIC
jgi:SAM-dependent methyltransferase